MKPGLVGAAPAMPAAAAAAAPQPFMAPTQAAQPEFAGAQVSQLTQQVIMTSSSFYVVFCLFSTNLVLLFLLLFRWRTSTQEVHLQAAW